MQIQPEIQFLQAAEHTVDGQQADDAQGTDFHQGLEGHGGDQAAVMFLVGAEQDGEHGQEHAVEQGHGFAEGEGFLQWPRCFPLGQQAQGIGHGLQLQGQQRQDRQ